MITVQNDVTVQLAESNVVVALMRDCFRPADHLCVSSDVNAEGTAGMRTKVKEVPCRDKAGNSAIVIEWEIRAEGVRCKSACCTAFSLEDGSPVTPLGGKFEHFYSGNLLTPV